MKPWTPRHSTIAGVALVAATNAVVLAGAAYNRSGDPEAMLRLSERELVIPEPWGLQNENGGISLTVQWRVLAPADDARSAYDYGFASVAGRGVWLDKAKLEALGFHTRPSRPDALDERYYEKQLPREVFLVLELDGPAYRSALALGEERLRRAQSRLKANPKVKELASAAEAAAKSLEREQLTNSRLFVVDAGLDSSRLRAQYPDRSRYAIVAGQIRVIRFRSAASPSGYLSGVSIDSINVPAAYRSVFASMPRRTYFSPGEKRAQFEATIAYGKRLEPWLVSARLGK